MKKVIALFVCLVVIFGLVACSSSPPPVPNDQNSEASNSTLSPKEKITVAYQYGIHYAPFQIMKEKRLIEKYYDNIDVDWLVLNSGAAINEGIVSRDIDVAAMGIGPFIIGSSNGVPYKMYSSLSSLPHGLLTNNPSLSSLSDFTSNNKIALVNIGSIQHILLSMKADKLFGDPHALDNNIVSMSHPDGMSALITNAVDAHLTAGSYVFIETEMEGITLIDDFTDVWPHGNTFIVGLASTSLYERNPELYNAVVSATNEAIEWLNQTPEEAAALLCETEGVDVETYLSWLKDPSCIFSTEERGLMDMAQFMEKSGFIDKAPEKLEDIVFEDKQLSSYMHSNYKE